MSPKRFESVAFNDFVRWPIASTRSRLLYRPGEARLLKWSQVRLDLGTCELNKHKTASRTGRQKTIYLTAPAIAILDNQPRIGEYVFTSRKGTPYTKAGMYTILNRRGCFPYMLRHPFAQQALNGGERLEMVQKLLGHARIATTAVYAQIRDERARRRAREMVTPIERAAAAKAESGSA